MKFSKHLVVFILSFFFIAGALVMDASAQNRRGTSAGATVVRRPVIVRRVYYRDPFWRTRYWGDPYWGYGAYYNPYLRYREQEYYLENRVRGNQRELNEHLRKYKADGVITPKEREELNDDYEDVRESIQELNEFRGNG